MKKVLLIIIIFVIAGLPFLFQYISQKQEFNYQNHECIKWKCEGWEKKHSFLPNREYWSNYWYECVPELFERKCYVENKSSEYALSVGPNSKVEMFPLGIEGEIGDKIICLEIPFESLDANLEYFEVVDKSLITYPYAECLQFIEKTCVPKS